MSRIDHAAPIKVLIENLNLLSKSGSSWNYNLGEVALTNLNKVHVQGEICKTAGFDNEILILNDGTGKAKITRSSQVPGDFSWVKAGVHCSVFGILVDNGKLPHIAATKIARIDNRILQEMWRWEVKELNDLMSNKVLPRLPMDSTSWLSSSLGDL